LLRSGRALRAARAEPAPFAEALQNAFDPARSENCIGLGQIARDHAAAWLPPGMAYGAAKDETGGSALIEADARDTEIDLDPLPAFLTDEEPAEAEGLALTAE
jgi:hypothetical protein